MLDARPSYDVAIEAYRTAHVARATHALEGDDSARASLLRARLSLHLGRWSQSALELRAIGTTPSTEDDRTQASLLVAAAKTQQRDFDEAMRILRVARVAAFGSSNRALEAEYHYYLGLWHFSGNQLAAAESACDAAIHCDLEYGFPVEIEYVIPIEISKSRALSLLGLIAGAREEYHRQARFFRQALERFEASGQRNDWTLAWLVMNLSYAARDLDLADDAKTLQALVRRPWSPDLAYPAFEVQRSLGWNAALAGALDEAVRRFDVALESAPTAAHELLVRAELGNVRREFFLVGDDGEVDRLFEAASAIDWEKTGEERSGLTFLAFEIARYDARRSRALLERYRSLTTKLEPRHLDSRDRRVVAFERLSEGAVLRAERRTADATRALLDAFEIWESVGYRWRAATAAIELAEITRSAFFADYARREASRRPASRLARRARDLSS